MQTTTDSASLLLYFRQVLGVQSVILPEVAQASAQTSVEQAFKKSVLFILDRELSAPAAELLSKMIFAMKLGSGAFEILNSLKSPIDLGLAHEGFRQLVEFTDDANALSHSESFTRTWSPEVLLVRPELKKRAWGDLQMVMKRLS